MKSTSRRVLVVLAGALVGVVVVVPTASATTPRPASCGFVPPAGPCTPPLVRGGAGIAANAFTQTNATVRIIFWGPGWPGPAGSIPRKTRDAVLKLFKALAANSPVQAAHYNKILDQYLGGAGTGRPGFGGSWIDTTAPPVIEGFHHLVLQQAQLVTEVDRAIGANPGWTAGANTQFMIFPQLGTKFTSSNGNPTLEPEEGVCGWHTGGVSRTNGVEVFDMDPFITNPRRCGSIETETAMTGVATHEWAEAATDPFGGSFAFTFLSAAANAGDSNICTNAPIPVGSAIQIVSTANPMVNEVHRTAATAPPACGVGNTVTLTTPLVNAYAQSDFVYLTGVSTTLTDAAVAGTNTICTSMGVSTGSEISVGGEVHYTSATAVAGPPCTGPYQETLTTPLAGAKGAGAAVVSNPGWITNQAIPPNSLWEIGDLCQGYGSSSLGPLVGGVASLWSNAAATTNAGKGCVLQA